LALASAALHLAGCGDVALPPPVAPTKVIPEANDVPTEPVPPGGGRVVLDANGEKARVLEVSGATFAGQGYQVSMLASRPLCASTPCVVDLARGPHRLVFVSPTDPNRGSAVEIDVGSRPKVVRHAMGERIEHGALRTAGTMTMSVGGLGVLTGGSILLTGLLLSGVDTASRSTDTSASIVSAGGAVLGIGAGVLALGVTLGILSRTEVRPGSTTEWLTEGEGRTPPDRGPTTTITSRPRLTPSANGVGFSF
jgi:hypothetical protein